MLKSEKVYLRPIMEEDLSNLNEWKNDEEIYRYLGGGFRPTSIDEQKKWINQLVDHSGSNKRFMICLKDTGESIGMIGLYDIHWINRSCELGVFLGKKEEMGKGYGVASCQVLEEYATEYLNLRKIKINVVAEDIGAYGLYKKLGYNEIGQYKKERFIQGQYRDLILMEKFLGHLD